MNNETLLGNVHYEGIGGRKKRKAKRAKRKDTRQQKRRDKPPLKERIKSKGKTALLAPVRIAFLGLVRLNVFGMADLMHVVNDPRMSPAKKAKAKPQIDKLYNTWYSKFGGNRTSLRKVVEKGAKERPFGFKLPIVKKFKFVQKLKEAGSIGKLDNRPIGLGLTGAEVLAAISSATPVILALTPVFIAIIAAVKGGGTPDVGNEDDFEDDFDDTSDSVMKTAGAGLIGVGILAALYFGTMKKK